jgi:hypothetical protein
MCVLIGAYYPADRATSKCATDPAHPAETSALGVEWVGNGAASCAETFDCVQQMLGGTGDFIDGVSTCINASDPAVSTEMSDALRCLFLNFGNAQTACQAEFAACLAK